MYARLMHVPACHARWAHIDQEYWLAEDSLGMPPCGFMLRQSPCTDARHRCPHPGLWKILPNAVLPHQG